MTLHSNITSENDRNDMIAREFTAGVSQNELMGIYDLTYDELVSILRSQGVTVN